MSVPLPAECWERIHEFAEGQRTGQVTLNFNRGKLESFEVKEHVRTPAPEKSA